MLFKVINNCKRNTVSKENIHLTWYQVSCLNIIIYYFDKRAELGQNQIKLELGLFLLRFGQ